MDRQKSLIGIGFVATALVISVTARAEEIAPIERPMVKVCNALSDTFASLVRNGDTENAKVLVPKVQKCLAIQKAALKEQVRKLADDFDEINSKSEKTR